MISRMTNGVLKLVRNFCTTHYTGATDGLASAPIYIDPEFDVTDDKKYARLLAAGNASFVIWEQSLTNDIDNSPTGYLRLHYTCKITLVTKSANQWDATNKLNRIQQGSTAAPLRNSVPAVLANLAAYAHQNRLNDGSGEVSFIQNVTDIEAPVSLGDFISYTANFEAKHMFSSTISVTPV